MENKENSNKDLETLCNLLSTKDGIEKVKNFFLKNYPPEINLPLIKYFSKKNSTLESLVDKITDNCLDSYNSKKISKSELEKYMSEIVKVKDLIEEYENFKKGKQNKK